MNIGARIRILREEKGLSLRKVANLSGISPSLLSQIETNRVDPSLSTLRKIAKALDVHVFRFLLENLLDPTGLVKKNERRLVAFPQGGLQYEIIHSDQQKKMGIHIGTLKPGGMTSEEPLAHSGEECIIVTNGVLNVEIVDATTVLKEGDSLYFDSSIPHRLYNESSKNCKFYLIITPPKF